MKFDEKDGPAGEFASKALVQTTSSKAWTLTEKFYFCLEAAEQDNPNFNVKWPVEVYDNSLLYVPDPSEMK